LFFITFDENWRWWGRFSLGRKLSGFERRQDTFIEDRVYGFPCSRKGELKRRFAVFSYNFEWPIPFVIELFSGAV
jgi:hypothetical protein